MRTIDMPVSWAFAVEIYIAALENGSEKGKQAAREEIRRMAKILDGARG